LSTPTQNLLAAALFARMLEKVEKFNVEIVGFPIPASPQTLGARRQEWAVGALNEELGEFVEANESGDVLEAADALVDLIYFALGRLVEMGIPAEAVFNEVQRANMSKERGQLSKRPGSQGYDAIKPEGWLPPDHSWLLQFTRGDLEAAALWSGLSPIIKKVSLLRAKKGNDYNTSVQLKDYFPFGHFSYAQMVHLKSTRMLSQLEVIKRGKALNFDGIQDTLEDLINYATFYAEAIESGQLPLDLGAAA
jgi:NTP pyrophosphatase (non-canonical NTP hydrolase)